MLYLNILNIIIIKKKSSTKFTPNEIRNINNEEQINLIIENMIKSSKKNLTYFIF